MNCVICLENMKSHWDPRYPEFNWTTETNWSQRCISCKDSWVCGPCYHEWDNNHSDPSCGYQTMPCVICKREMIYSRLVNMFDEGTGMGWWDDSLLAKRTAFGGLYKILERNCEL
jgi:hypothetical protein